MRSTIVLLLVTAVATACGGSMADHSTDGAAAAPAPPGPAPSASPPGSSPPTPSLAACPAFLPPPTHSDCGEWSAACEGVGVIAVGTFTRIKGLAVQDGYAYWIAAPTDLTPGCGNVIYRSSRGFGATAIASSTSEMTSVAADADAVYWTERAGDHLAVHAGGAVIGTLAGDAGGLVQTAGRVLIVEGTTIWRVSPSGLEAIAQLPANAHAGSLPELDGDGVFVVLETADGVGPLVRAQGSSITTLAEGATARGRRTIAIARDDGVYFVTGDDVSWDHGKLLRPMGISRVPRAGGPATTIVRPSSTEMIRSIHAVNANGGIDFVVGHEVRAVADAGIGAVEVLTLPEEPHDAVVYGRALFYRFDVGGARGEVTAPGGIIGANAIVPD